jgi:hypothetical protein
MMLIPKGINRPQAAENTDRLDFTLSSEEIPTGKQITHIWIK